MMPDEAEGFEEAEAEADTTRTDPVPKRPPMHKTLPDLLEHEQIDKTTKVYRVTSHGKETYHVAKSPLQAAGQVCEVERCTDREINVAFSTLLSEKWKQDHGEESE